MNERALEKQFLENYYLAYEKMIDTMDSADWKSFFHSDFSYGWKKGNDTIGMPLDELEEGCKSYHGQLREDLEIEVLEKLENGSWLGIAKGVLADEIYREISLFTLDGNKIKTLVHYYAE